MIFDKPYNSVAEQLARLEEKAMVIDVLREEAERVIESITYYRFSGYALPFLDRTTDCYTGSLKFSDVLALYRFDSELRSKMISALCAVEVTLRTIVSNEFSAVHGPLGYLDAKNFALQNEHAGIMKKIGSEFNRSKQPCAEHFRSRYDNPPLWAVVDVMTFGTISLLLKAMSRPDQNAVASHYGIRGDYLASYMQHATVLRNLCAHHCRVFDFPYSNLKTPPREFVFAPLNIWKKRGVDIRADRPFIYQAALLYHLLAPTGNAVFSREDWKQDICSHFRSLPESISRRVCGYIDFPTDAESSPLWSL